ncbi:hypothetical protein [Corynebacterium freiburgense]|uniref:hypothetical protein n=1 Tax=Corynebacterium freiburgense TaxID=556548 RepID=UPI0004016FBD|nr:hypothetical protein [Corynebacterium freiburgense]WJZ03752.1 hypothetical protein CFREI_12475 [Corynebacterium freiburgense]
MTRSVFKPVLDFLRQHGSTLGFLVSLLVALVSGNQDAQGLLGQEATNPQSGHTVNLTMSEANTLATAIRNQMPPNFGNLMVVDEYEKVAAANARASEILNGASTEPIEGEKEVAYVYDLGAQLNAQSVASKFLEDEAFHNYSQTSTHYCMGYAYSPEQLVVVLRFTN